MQTKFVHLTFLLLLGLPAIAQTSSGYLDNSSAWKWEHDAGTPGSSTGQLIFNVANPSVNGAATEFVVSYSDYGGERFHLVFGNDTNASYFIYDTWVYLVNPTQVQNLELDADQVTANGETIIQGTQCSSISGTWEYTYVSNSHAHWQRSNLPCNPQNWAPNKWHHIQISMHRDSNGVVTHEWVALDGVTHHFQNATASSALSLHWSEGELIVNVQFDGEYPGHGSIKSYFDKLTITRY